MSLFSKTTTQIILIASALLFHCATALFVVLNWEKIPTSVVVHYGPGWQYSYGEKTFGNVFYFSIIAGFAEACLFLIWLFITHLRKSTPAHYASSALPVCIFLVSAGSSLVNIASVSSIDILKPLSVILMILMCVFLPSMWLLFANFQPKPQDFSRHDLTKD